MLNRTKRYFESSQAESNCLFKETLNFVNLIENYDKKDAFFLSPIESNGERYSRAGDGLCIIETKICRNDAKNMSNSAMIGAYFHI